MNEKSYDELEKKLRGVEELNPAEKYLLELLEIKNRIDALKLDELTVTPKYNSLVCSIDSLIVDFIYRHGHKNLNNKLLSIS